MSAEIPIRAIYSLSASGGIFVGRTLLVEADSKEQALYRAKAKLERAGIKPLHLMVLGDDYDEYAFVPKTS